MSAAARVGPWLLILASSVGCSDAAEVLGDACEPEVTIAASASRVPEFTWTPDCAVNSLTVTTEPGDLLWTVFAQPEPDQSPTNHIRSGVTYGTAPPMSLEPIEPVALEPGQRFRVLLHVADTHGEDTLVGNGLFTVPAE